LQQESKSVPKDKKSFLALTYETKKEGIHLGQKKYAIGILLLGIVTLALLSGCTGFAFICEEQSRQKMATCNTDCGEGILSELCKTKCTIENNERINQCNGS